MGDQFDDKEELTEAAGENEQENDKDEYENFVFSAADRRVSARE